MRIISQGGHADLPYERTHLCSNTENVIARCDGKEYLMGRYSTHEKAFKAMEMCREEWTKVCGVGMGLHTQPNILTWPKVFQFPKDEEVEV